MHDFALEDSGFQLYSLKDLNLIDNKDQTSLVNSFKNILLILPFDRDINSWGSNRYRFSYVRVSALPDMYTSIDFLTCMIDRQFFRQVLCSKGSYASILSEESSAWGSQYLYDHSLVNMSKYKSF